MKVKTLEEVLSEANAAWDKDEKNKGNESFKASYLFGWLQVSYKSLYDSLPKNKKK